MDKNLIRKLAYDLLPVDEQFFSVLGLTKDSPEMQEIEQLESSRRLSGVVFLSDYISEYSKAIAEVINKMLAEDNGSDPAREEEREEVIESALVVFCAHMLRDGIMMQGIIHE